MQGQGDLWEDKSVHGFMRIYTLLEFPLSECKIAPFPGVFSSEL